MLISNLHTKNNFNYSYNSQQKNNIGGTALKYASLAAKATCLLTVAYVAGKYFDLTLQSPFANKSAISSHDDAFRQQKNQTSTLPIKSAFESSSTTNTSLINNTFIVLNSSSEKRPNTLFLSIDFSLTTDDILSTLPLPIRMPSNETTAVSLVPLLTKEHSTQLSNTNSLEITNAFSTTSPISIVPKNFFFPISDLTSTQFSIREIFDSTLPSSFVNKSAVASCDDVFTQQNNQMNTPPITHTAKSLSTTSTSLVIFAPPTRYKFIPLNSSPEKFLNTLSLLTDSSLTTNNDILSTLSLPIRMPSKATTAVSLVPLLTKKLPTQLSNTSFSQVKDASRVHQGIGNISLEDSFLKESRNNSLMVSNFTEIKHPEDKLEDCYVTVLECECNEQMPTEKNTNPAEENTNCFNRSEHFTSNHEPSISVHSEDKKWEVISQSPNTSIINTCCNAAIKTFSSTYKATKCIGKKAFYCCDTFAQSTRLRLAIASSIFVRAQTCKGSWLNTQLPVSNCLF